jgi:hypothetical protein
MPWLQELCQKLTLTHDTSQVLRGEKIDVQYFYIRNDYYKPMITLCFITEYSSHTLIALGVAVCSSHDTPSKKVGKLIATGRAFKNFKNGVIFSQENVKNSSTVQDCYRSAMESLGRIPWFVEYFFQSIGKQST